MDDVLESIILGRLNTDDKLAERVTSSYWDSAYVAPGRPGAHDV